VTAITLTATYVPGWQLDNGDFSAATVRYVINDGRKRLAMSASDLIMLLVDERGFEFTFATHVTYRLWDQAEAAPTHTVTVPW
jgi:hypothetical protein